MHAPHALRTVPKLFCFNSPVQPWNLILLHHPLGVLYLAQAHDPLVPIRGSPSLVIVVVTRFPPLTRVYDVLTPRSSGSDHGIVVVTRFPPLTRVYDVLTPRSSGSDHGIVVVTRFPPLTRVYDVLTPRSSGSDHGIVVVTRFPPLTRVYDVLTPRSSGSDHGIVVVTRFPPLTRVYDVLTPRSSGSDHGIVVVTRFPPLTRVYDVLTPRSSGSDHGIVVVVSSPPTPDTGCNVHVDSTGPGPIVVGLAPLFTQMHNVCVAILERHSKSAIVITPLQACVRNLHMTTLCSKHDEVPSCSFVPSPLLSPHSLQWHTMPTSHCGRHRSCPSWCCMRPRCTISI